MRRVFFLSVSGGGITVIALLKHIRLNRSFFSGSRGPPLPLVKQLLRDV